MSERKKFCKGCQKHRSRKAFQSFYSNQEKRVRISYLCRRCINKKRRQRYQSIPIAERKLLEIEKHLKKKYNLGTKDYDAILLSQKGHCAICRGNSAGTASGRFCIDHCHSTGRVRGLLCRKCNLALGFLQDNMEFMRRAIDYLSSCLEDRECQFAAS